MCIAIVKKKNGNISNKQLENCFENNSDGAGIAYTKNNKLYVVKGIFNKKEFIKKVREIEKIADSNMLIHCRIGTSGLMDSTNCHPHLVNENLALIHNGIINIPVPDKSKISDTVIFVQDVLQNLPKNFLENKAIMDLLKEALGGYNKICFLDNTGKYTIINEKAGEWKNNVWYSNSSYKYRTYSFKNNKHFKYNTIYKNNYYDEYEYNYNIWDEIEEERMVDIYEYVYDQIEDMTEDDVYYFGEEIPLINLETGELEKYSPHLEKNSLYMKLEDMGYEVLQDYAFKRRMILGEDYVPIK